MASGASGVGTAVAVGTVVGAADGVGCDASTDGARTKADSQKDEADSICLTHWHLRLAEFAEL